MNNLNFNLKLNANELALFASNLDSMLKAGLTLGEAMGLLAEQANWAQKKLFLDICAKVESGKSFADTLSFYPRTFPELFRRLVQAGETSGNLAENLHELSAYFEKQKQVRDKIRSAMVYPAIVLVMSVALTIFININIFPKIMPLFRKMNIELPILTQILIGFSSFISSYGTIIALAVIAIAGLMVFANLTKALKPYCHAILFRLPIFGRIISLKNISFGFRTLGVFLKSGFAIDEALEATAQAATNNKFRLAFLKLAENAREGQTLSSGLKQQIHIFPRMIQGITKVGERSGNLGEQCTLIACYYEQKTNKYTNSLSTLLEPLLLIFIGLLVAVFALGIITPIYKISGSITN